MIHIKRPYQPVEQMLLEHANSLIRRGELSGQELAWQPGMPEWKQLSTIPGIISINPPPLPLEIPPPIRERQTRTPFSNVTDRPNAPNGTHQTEPDRRCQGVGGWLLFFCVGLTILGPLFSIGQMADNWKQSQNAIAIFPSIKSAIIWENLGSTVILILGLIVGCKVWSGNVQVLKIVRRYLVCRLVIFVAVQLIALLIIHDVPRVVFLRAAGGMIGPIGREIAYFVIWWFYFKKSKRVRNTYSTDQHDY